MTRVLDNWFMNGCAGGPPLENGRNLPTVLQGLAESRQYVDLHKARQAGAVQLYLEVQWLVREPCGRVMGDRGIAAGLQPLSPAPARMRSVSQ